MILALKSKTTSVALIYPEKKDKIRRFKKQKQTISMSHSPQYSSTNSGTFSNIGTIDFLLKEAENKKMEGKHQEAIKLCEKVLIQDLECLEAYEEIGDNYLSLRQYEKAKKALNKAYQLNSRSANTNYLLGFVYSSLGEWRKSIEYLERADSIEPNHPEILRCLGWSIFHGVDRQKGVILLERALNLSPNDPLILSDLGVCYLNQRKFERARFLFKKILEIDPQNEKARECLNAIRFFQKEFDKFRKEK